MKHIFITLGLALVIVGCSDDKKAENGGAQAQQTPTVDVAQVVESPVTLTKTYPGHLTANNKVDVMAQVSGYLTSKPFKSGSYVSKGQVLFTIEDTKYRNAVTEAEAALANARSANAYNVERYNAMRKAYESEAVSQMDVIQAKSTMEEGQAQIRDAEAALSSAQKNLSYCTVRAPFSGHISDATVDVGAYISGPSQVLATIYDDSSLKAEFAIEDTRYLDLMRDRAAENNLDLKHIPVEFTEQLPHAYTADLSYMAPSIDPTTGTMAIQADISNRYGELKTGMYCQVSLPYGSDSKAILVRDASIGTDQLGKYVYVVDDADRVVYTPIQVGEMANDSMRIVTKGLTPGDRYVSRALLKVRDGMKVNPRG